MDRPCGGEAEVVPPSHGEPTASGHDDSAQNASHTSPRRMKTLLTAAWVSTQIHVIAAVGLAPSHAAPFMRLLYQIPKHKATTKEKRQSGDAAGVVNIVSLDNAGAELRLRREHNGRYTALWGNATGSSDDTTFRILTTAKRVEIQLWNHFANGFEVFLGATTVSIETLHQQLCDSGDESKSFASSDATVSIVAAPAMWYPLQLAKDNVHAAQRYLSVQLQISFVCDRKAYAIRQKIAQRASTREPNKSKAHGGQAGDEKRHAATSIADPAFAFTTPFHPIDWSSVADVDRWSSFATQVLYGDLAHELQDDLGLHVHEHHVAAFQLCQFSAQYLDHCVNTLAARKDDYCDQYRVLTETYEELANTRSQLRLPVRSPAKSTQNDSLKADSMKKPVFLVTWEERERERKLEKELSKTQLIEDEKRRLEQLALDRKARDEHQLRLSSLLARGREHAACVIQRFTRQKNAKYKLKAAAERHRAAMTIQRHVRGYKCRKVYPSRLEQHKVGVESSLMEQNELEMRTFLEHEGRQRQQQQMRDVDALSQDFGPASPSPNKQEVGDLVAMWRKLRRIFVVAHSTSGTHYCSLFQKLDLRQDGTVDRAEFRLGVRSFGIRIDRTLTRAKMAGRATHSWSRPVIPVCLHLALVTGNLDADRQQEAKPRTRGDDAYSNNDDSDDDTASKVARAVESLRQKIVDAATSHLEALGKTVSNYRDFRDALMRVFEEFDVDKSGELDMNEFVACIESINFRVTKDNLALLRECFAWDHESDRIGTAEFISFALARPELDGGGDENLGVVGSRMRDGILQRVRAERKQTDTTEDAVRLVFRRAYRTQADQQYPVAIFMKTLSALQLGIKPAQLARLVMRLDKDSDRSISFHELLVWLRLQSSSTEDDSIEDRPNRFHGHVPTNSTVAMLVRTTLHQIAGFDDSTSSQASRQGLLRRVFEKIDSNNSKKITKQRIQQFLGSEDLGPMRELVDALNGQAISPKRTPAVLADAIADSIGLNRNGVITLDEWLEYLEPTEQNPAARMDRFAMIDSVRAALRVAMKDKETLIAWLHSLPGAIPVPPKGHTVNEHMKVRISEFKTALRSKLGAPSLPLQAIEEAIKRLDSGSSGWITTLEMQNWAFPLRDLEELVATIINRWHECSSVEVQPTSSDDFAFTLYNRFDADGNGILAQREVRGGFASFGLHFRQEEVAALVHAFDLDHDGCWSKAEFLAFVYKISPQQIFPQNELEADAATGAAYEDEQAAYEDEGFQSSDAKDDAGKLGDLEGGRYEEDHFSSPSSSSAALSLPPDSPGNSSAADTGARMASEYSEDFD